MRTRHRICVRDAAAQHDDHNDQKGDDDHVQANNNHAKVYYYSPTNNYDNTADDNDFGNPDNYNFGTDNYDAAPVYHDFRNSKSDEHNETARNYNECPACCDDINFYIKHEYNGPDLPDNAWGEFGSNGNEQ